MIAVLRACRAALAAVAFALCVGCTTDATPDAAAIAARPKPDIPIGKSRLDFSSWAGRPFPVFLYRPAAAGADAPIVFVMHGARRNGDEYRDAVAPLADIHGFIVVAPQFSREDFPGAEGYILGGATDRQGRPLPRETWTFSAIEPVFDHIRASLGSTRTTYSLFGHSGGGQFVHRFLLAAPDARVDRAVAANPGWYTMPDPATPWPFGLGGAPFAIDMADWFRAPMTVLLGTADVLRTDNLNQTPEADAQGPHRLARGKAFYAAAQARAAADGLALAWAIAFVEGVGHDHAPMAAGAIDRLLPQDAKDAKGDAAP